MERHNMVLEEIEAEIQRHMEALEKKISAAKLTASQSGALGGSRSVQQIVDLSRAEFNATAQQITSMIMQHDGANASDYAAPIRDTLERLAERILMIFMDNHRKSPFSSSAHLLAQDLGEGLAKVLVSDREGAVRKFELAVTAPQQGDEDFSLMVLRHFAKVDKAHKTNVIGRPFQEGFLELESGRKFTNDERARVRRLIDAHIKDGLLESTNTDIADPDNWLCITEAGRSAVARGALDDFDASLKALSPRFLDMRHGAWAAAATSSNPDAIRQAAHSARELVSQVLDHLAPVEKLEAVPNFVPGTKVTRRMKIKYAIGQRASGASQNDVDIADAANNLLDLLHKKLSSIAHTRDAHTAREVKTLLSVTETILQLLLF